MIYIRSQVRRVFVTLGFFCALSLPAKADMFLTTDGVAAGLSLTQFATGFDHIGNTSTGVGPLGIAFGKSGVVLVDTWPGDLYRLTSHANGQTVTSANIVSGTGAGTFVGMATYNGLLYEADRTNQAVFQVTTNDNFVSVGYNYVASTSTFAGDLLTNYATGKLLETTSAGLIEINPGNGSIRVISSRTGGDGMVIDPTGTTVYVAYGSYNDVLGFNIKTGAQVYDSGFTGLGQFFMDGLALGSGTQAGKLYINTNSGGMWSLNLNDTSGFPTMTQLLGSTSRGDFMTVDPTDGSLLITQSNSIYRLTAPTGAAFAASVPEPTSFVLLGLGLSFGYAMMRRNRRSITTSA